MGDSRAPRRRVKRGAKAGARVGWYLASHFRTCAQDDRDFSAERCLFRQVHATVGSALGRREIRQQAGGCSGDEPVQPGVPGTQGPKGTRTPKSLPARLSPHG